MEQRLYQAAQLLPVAEVEIPQIGSKIVHQKVIHTKRWARATAIIVVILICATTVFAFAKGSYGLWSGMHSNGYSDVQILNWKYDYNFPKSLYGLPFSGMSTYYGAPQGATHLEALLAPTYALHNVDYGSYDGEAQTDGTILWDGKRIAIAFGTTENENWKYHFSVAEDGSCDYKGVQPGSQSSEEYRGYTLYLYTVSYPSVRWVDEKRNLVIDMTCYGYKNQEEVLEVAKELIDLNATE